MGDHPTNLHGLKAKMTTVKGRITRALKKIEITCVEFVKQNEETIPALTINRLHKKFQKTEKNWKKELKRMEDIATSFPDVIAISAPRNSADINQKELTHHQIELIKKNQPLITQKQQ